MPNMFVSVSYLVTLTVMNYVVNYIDYLYMAKLDKSLLVCIPDYFCLFQLLNIKCLVEHLTAYLAFYIH